MTDTGMKVWREAVLAYDAAFCPRDRDASLNDAAAVITAAMAQDKAEIERLREALGAITNRPGEGVEYFPGHGDEPCSEARHMELIARQALTESPSHDQ